MGGKKSDTEFSLQKYVEDALSGALLASERRRAPKRAQVGKPTLGGQEPLSARWRSIFSLEAEPFARKMMALAKKGNPSALRFVSEEMRYLRRTALKIGPLSTLTEIAEAQDDIVDAIRMGELSVADAAALSTVLDNVGEAMKRRELEARLSEVEIFITENHKP